MNLELYKLHEEVVKAYIEKEVWFLYECEISKGFIDAIFFEKECIKARVIKNKIPCSGYILLSNLHENKDDLIESILDEL